VETEGAIVAINLQRPGRCLGNQAGHHFNLLPLSSFQHWITIAVVYCVSVFQSVGDVQCLDRLRTYNRCLGQSSRSIRLDGVLPVIHRRVDLDSSVFGSVIGHGSIAVGVLVSCLVATDLR
jgi:hypothetical protein